MSNTLSQFPNMGNFHYESTAHLLNELIAKLDAEAGTPAVGTVFPASGDWLANDGTFRLNLLRKYLATHKGFTEMAEPLPEGVDWHTLQLPALLGKMGVSLESTSKRKIDTIVILGASILQQSFTDQKYATRAFLNKGNVVSIHNKAVSGNTSQDILDRLDTIVSEFENKAETTLFVFHGTGNDLKFKYPSNADVMDTNIRSILQTIKDKGFMLAVSDLTYRKSGAKSANYNSGIIEKIREDFADIPLFLYKLTEDNKDRWHSADGVHPSDEGKEITVDYLADEISPYIQNVNPESGKELKDVLLQFGNREVMTDGKNVVPKALNLTGMPIYNTDYTQVEDAIVGVKNTRLINTQGRGNTQDPTDTSLTITNHNGLKEVAYTDVEARPIFLDFSQAKLDLDAKYRVQVTASRDVVASDRISEFNIADEIELVDATSDPAEIAEVTVLGANLASLGIYVTKPSNSRYAYVSMIRITKEV